MIVNHMLEKAYRKIFKTTERQRPPHVTEGLTVINNAFATVPRVERRDLLCTAEEIFSQREGTEKAHLVKALFESSDGQVFTSSIEKVGLKPQQLPGLIEDMAPFVSTMLDFPERYRFQLGIIFSQTTVDQFPEYIQNKITPQGPSLKWSVTPSHGQWWLCSTGEIRLTDSISDTAVIAITDGEADCLLVKFCGRLSAVCLRNTKTETGTMFIQGNWYSPTDQGTKDMLRSSFGAQKGRVAMQTGNWTLMRQLSSVYKVTDAQQVAQHTPDIYPNSMISVGSHSVNRAEYQRLREEFYYL
jgi:hypothetical protein